MAQEPREVNPVTFFDPLKGRPTDKDFAVRAVPSDEPDPNEVIEAPKAPDTSVTESVPSLEQTPSETEEKSAPAEKAPASQTIEPSKQTSSSEVKETSTGNETPPVTPTPVVTQTSGSLASAK